MVVGQTVKLSVSRAKDSIKAAKESLSDVVKSLKPGLNKEGRQFFFVSIFGRKFFRYLN